MIYKRLLRRDEKTILIHSPVSNAELLKRQADYQTLTPNKFSSNRRKEVYTPVSFEWNGKIFELQYNSCTNPLCKNFGLPQEQFKVKSKSSRYKLIGVNLEKSIFCNKEVVDPTSPPTGGCKGKTLSNWSLAEEIERLIRINQIKPIEKEYEFHSHGCSTKSHTPKTNPKSFYKRGTNSAKSQRFQCKDCKKITSVSPDKTRNSTFNQKRNEIMPTFAKLLINKTPINRTCEILDIGKGTYYDKLEWLYRCCLEFLETRETKPLAKTHFQEMWITTDKLHYVLNNVLKKGRGKNRGRMIEDKQLPTYIVASAHIHSRYVFRSDICFDWEKSLEEVEEETAKYKDDHLYTFLRKNDRFGIYGAAPMLPTKNDKQSMNDYREESKVFNLRKEFVDGLHTNQTYTSMAQFWLLKQTLSADKWRFISDDDRSLKKAIASIFKDEIKNGSTHHFLCLTDKTLTRGQAKHHYFSAIQDLIAWGKRRSIGNGNLFFLAHQMIEEDLSFHKFHNQHIAPNGEIYFTQGMNRMKHPIPTSDRGHRYLDVLTDTWSLSDKQLADLLVQVNDNAINAFFQTIRRRLSILERPLVTARGDGKSYIYSNFNPKYSQMTITILRTYYNFCMEFKTPGRKATPAQRLGIADRVYTWEDIIYKR